MNSGAPSPMRSVSRTWWTIPQHLVFEREGTHWVVRDLGSTNGTFVNARVSSADKCFDPGTA